MGGTGGVGMSGVRMDGASADSGMGGMGGGMEDHMGGMGGLGIDGVGCFASSLDCGVGCARPEVFAQNRCAWHRQRMREVSEQVHMGMGSMLHREVRGACMRVRGAHFDLLCELTCAAYELLDDLESVPCFDERLAERIARQHRESEREYEDSLPFVHCLLDLTLGEYDRDDLPYQYLPTQGMTLRMARSCHPSAPVRRARVTLVWRAAMARRPAPAVLIRLGRFRDISQSCRP